MATLSEVEEHRSAVEDVITLAVAELASEWVGLPGDPVDLGEALSDLLADLYADFSSMTATLAADWYDDLRLDANVTGSYVSALAPGAPVEQIQASADWAASAAWVDSEKALRDSAGFLDRILADRDRATIDLNVGRDPAKPKYARHASANACAFCAVNAMRGPVFRSEDAAGKKYHDRCACIAVPSWTRDDYSEAPFVADWREAYYSATAAVGTSNIKAVLAHMRENAGLR